jgi:RNA polymerase sigma-70 factor (ECF subfamily)
VLPTDVITRARTGDQDAFRELIEPYRRELHVHCYRMLGSFQDAEDALQDVLLTAWRGLSNFEGRATLRTWLYRIATNRCLDVLRTTRRRPSRDWSVPDVEPPEPSRLGEVVWLEPYPDALLADESLMLAPLGPEARYEQTEAISLAFVTALQVMPARQRAVLILRDVLGYHASEVAEMLDASLESVTSALKRARAGMQRRFALSDSAPPNSPVEQSLVERFVSAYESADIDTLVALLTEDVRVSMPPVPLEYHGREPVERFFAALLGGGRRYRLVPTRANGQWAFGAYLRSSSGASCHAAGLVVLTARGDQISAITRFDNNTLPWFGLPPSLHA